VDLNLSFCLQAALTSSFSGGRYDEFHLPYTMQIIMLMKGSPENSISYLCFPTGNDLAIQDMSNTGDDSSSALQTPAEILSEEQEAEVLNNQLSTEGIFLFT
jgi:uroporphyrinogen-III decarboxylase